MDFLDIFSTTVLPWSHARKKKLIQERIQDFFLAGAGGWGDEPLRNGVTDWGRKQILKANAKKKAFD